MLAMKQHVFFSSLRNCWISKMNSTRCTPVHAFSFQLGICWHKKIWRWVDVEHSLNSCARLLINSPHRNTASKWSADTNHLEGYTVLWSRSSFLNCVLSAVLSYQLSWLSTVSPSLVKSKQLMPFKSKADYVRWRCRSLSSVTLCSSIF